MNLDPSREDTPLIKVCIGEGCDGADPEHCQLCTVIDPLDPDWEAAFERAQGRH